MNHIISNVKEGFSKAVSTTKDKLSQVKGSISNIHVSSKRRRGTAMPSRNSRTRITMQRPARRATRRYTAHRVNRKRFTVVVAVAVVAIMVPVMVMAANGDTAQVEPNVPEMVQVAEYNVEAPAETTQAVAAVPELTETTQAAVEESTVTSDGAVADDAAIAETAEEPTPTPEPTPQYVMLTEGMNDASVPALQQRLMDLYYMGADETTDYYGPQTAQAIKYFQRKHGLAIDGAAGPETQALLFSDQAKEYTMSLGAEGYDVERMQERLMALGYPISSASGYFGEETEKAVQYFQRMNGLTDDGSVGHMTEELIYSDEAEKALEYEAPKKENDSSDSKGSSSSGNKGNSSSSGGNKGNSSSGGSGSSSPSYTADPGSVEAFIDVAMAQVGKPYSLGAKGPDAFDCSGFIYYALKESGNGIGYMTSSGWANSGYTSVGWDDLQRGDIVCVSGHVAIYLGGGQVIDASSSQNAIVVRGLGSWFQSRFICGKRPL
ncbi:C40 family peptidase [Christensenella tenuis]|uniref:Peptidoglycan-binding protein n=1 Tax=Christensenella tenuis TaxID=2763033 RepID=A0ABR7ED52_9FIRM|nr:peptidoglycan-binding protein [Christensenella tenuis]MBC5646959.1 peptidoglycan-binding protein [Christensenella tenuis]